MDINRKNPDKWNEDIQKSVAFYNNWFVNFAPPAFRNARKISIAKVNDAFRRFRGLQDLSDDLLIDSPPLLTILRMMTCPPLAGDRLAGLAGVPASIVEAFETGKATQSTRREHVSGIMSVIRTLLDVDLVSQGNLAAFVVSDRLCRTLTDSMVRNGQEKRQVGAIAGFLKGKGYVEATPKSYKDLRPGEYAIHLNLTVRQGAGVVKLPGDVSILPRSARPGDLPVLIEAKSAGDFTNVNKRRKEEATKIHLLKDTYGDARFLLFLGGYFDRGYLDFEAAEGIDWIWEHRVSDMEKLGL